MRIGLTGATGFVGRSLLDEVEASLATTGHLDYCKVLVRDVPAAKALLDPQHQRPWLKMIEGNVLSNFPDFGDVDILFHFAVPASAKLNHEEPEAMFDVNVRGMTNLLRAVLDCPHPPRVILSSSGAVYGSLAEPVQESFPVLDMSSAQSAYARGKLGAESQLLSSIQRDEVDGCIARMFSFSGIHIPLDQHFAVGNFVKEVVTRQSITTRSDGRSVRSYLDATDMSRWLLQIAVSGTRGGVYHVGSERSITIADLAKLIALRYERLTSRPTTVRMLGMQSPLDGTDYYVPSTAATRRELHVQETISLEESIDKMILNALASTR